MRWGPRYGDATIHRAIGTVLVLVVVLSILVLP